MTDASAKLANDRHHHGVPLLVIGILLLLTYVWTDWMSAHPFPGSEVIANHALFSYGMSSDDHFQTSLWMHKSSDLSNHEQRRVLFLIAGIAFLLFYYLPVAYKKTPLVALTAIGIVIVLDAWALLLFLAWHFFAYINFHAPSPTKISTVALLILLTLGGWISVFDGDSSTAIQTFLLFVATVPMVYLVYATIYYPLLKTRFKTVIGLCTAHSSLIFIVVSLVLESEFNPVGWLLFFWQWERMVLYHADLVDGKVPDDLSPFAYIATFFSPAMLANFHWLSRTPLGYAYVTESFLARDKNKIILSGLYLIVLSAVFYFFRPILLKLLRMGMDYFDLVQMRNYNQFVSAIQDGNTPDVLSAWVLLFYSFFNLYLLWTAVAHFKIGMWRLFGYDIEPHFQKPFLATNFIEFWKRYSYYYREFLVRAFYYPVFLRFFKKQPKLRVFAATFAAAGFGNLVYHVMYTCLYRGSTWDVIIPQLRTIPYYILLGVIIASTQVWLLRRGRKRKPWTRGWRIILDVLSVIGTIGLFILIRPFHHIPLDNSIEDATKVVFAALGLA